MKKTLSVLLLLGLMQGKLSFVNNIHCPQGLKSPSENTKRLL